VMNVFVKGPGGSSPSTFGPSISNAPVVTTPTWPSEAVSVSTSGRSVVLHYQSATAHSIELMNGAGQSQTYRLNASQPFNENLDNANAQASLFEVKVSDSGPDEFIAVPGTTSVTSASDNGTVSDFAKALADKFNCPVILKVQDPSKMISWNLDADNARLAAQKSLEGENFDVTLTATKVVTITSK
jgi:hypothetical protein